MSPRRTAKIVLLMFSFSSLCWSVFLPVFEAPDETTAYEYARFMAREWRIPDLRERPNPGFHHWQPLYFFLLAPVAKLTNAPESYGSRYYFEDGWRRIREENPPNILRHEIGELTFGWDRIAWSLHLMRLVSVLLATGSVWLVFLTAREIFPSGWLPIIAMVLVGFNPQFTHLSGALNVVNMVIFSSTVFFWLLVRYLGRRPSWTQGAMLGAALGVSVLSKMTSLSLLPLPILAILIHGKRRKDAMTALAIFAVAFLLFGGWFLVRNLVLYGELSGVNAQVVMIYGRMLNPYMEEVGRLNYFISYPKTQWQTFWSGFGWVTIHLPLWFPLTMLLVYFHGIWGFIQLLREKTLAWYNRRQMTQLSFLVEAPLLAWLGITWTIVKVEVFHGKDMLFISGPLVIVVLVGLVHYWRISGNKGRRFPIGRWIIPLVALAVFWLRQPEMARTAKGIATAEDWLAMARVAVASWMALTGIWWIIRQRRFREMIEGFIGRPGVMLSLIVAAAALNLFVLFGIVVRAMYHLG